jgi:predicted nucleic acid-binding protein
MGDEMVKPSVYIETTIPSYLTAWRSPELMMAGNQEATRAWWDTDRQRFDMFISEAVLYEAGCGDVSAAERRRAVLEGLPELDINAEVEELTKRLLAEHALPQNARDDALHIAVAAVHGMDYLLTWNCRHIANALMRPKIERTCRMAGYEPADYLYAPGIDGGVDVQRQNS